MVDRDMAVCGLEVGSIQSNIPTEEQEGRPKGLPMPLSISVSGVPSRRCVVCVNGYI